ncbi:excalibur calcium-binding domain-containing protein [Corynebacterium sp. zg-913]|uniref:Excalibur calcium-binding domain-containing protein n=1 Tax=Corynebacterium wankanglinii TaxID=2735136 RepID=A0A7H0KC35_9CORY|nr:excalibur calcium-binding domain-containing protein [Corynebacterium wankanglinii]QNP94851.1 excalibur calcium-binding domain-containing protein [Corynebacterium wankanglinii]
MKQGIIPNPAPQLIPCHPAAKPAPAPAPAPAPRPAPAPAPRPAPAPAPRPAPAPAPAPRPAAASKSYPNCRAVWNDLGRPIRRGEAGYGSHLDRDGDGVGCEKRPK